MTYLVLTALLLAKPHPVRDDKPVTPAVWTEKCLTVWDMEDEPICQVRKA